MSVSKDLTDAIKEQKKVIDNLSQNMERLFGEYKKLKSDLRVMIEALEEIRDDNTHDEDIVCGAYTEHREIARKSLEKIKD